MKKQNRLYTYFKKWLREHRHEFRFVPQIAYIKRNQFRVYFKDCGKNIFLMAGDDGEFSLWIKFHDSGEVLYDWVADYDFYLLKNSLGYYCGLCEDEKRIYYKDREELLRIHVFDRMLETINEDLEKYREKD